MRNPLSFDVSSKVSSRGGRSGRRAGLAAVSAVLATVAVLGFQPASSFGAVAARPAAVPAAKPGPGPVPAKCRPVLHGLCSAPLPVSWPVAVPVPAGLVTGANNPSAGVWVAGMLLGGDATAVRASLIAFYQAHGFTVDAVAFIPTILRSTGYVIRVAMFPRDHTAETLIALTVTRR